MTKRELNILLKNYLPVFARVCEARVNQFVIGGEASTDLHLIADEVKIITGAKSVWSYGQKNYLTLNF